MKYLFIPLLLGFITIGCRNSNTVQIDNSELISVKVSSETIPVSEIIENFQIVALKAPENILVGEISYIKKTSDKIVLADCFSKCITIFDNSGNYITQINRAGRGAGEYIDLTLYDAYFG